MQISTNVDKSESQATVIKDLIHTMGGEFRSELQVDQNKDQLEIISSWLQWCSDVPASERLSTKCLTTNRRKVRLAYNNTNGSVKVQFGKLHV